MALQRDDQSGGHGQRGFRKRAPGPASLSAGWREEHWTSALEAGQRVSELRARGPSVHIRRASLSSCPSIERLRYDIRDDVRVAAFHRDSTLPVRDVIQRRQRCAEDDIREKIWDDIWRRARSKTLKAL